MANNQPGARQQSIQCFAWLQRAIDRARCSSLRQPCFIEGFSAGRIAIAIKRRGERLSGMENAIGVSPAEDCANAGYEIETAPTMTRPNAQGATYPHQQL
jgi:hypothetical protein